MCMDDFTALCQVLERIEGLQSLDVHVYAPRTVHCHPDGGQLDIARLPARTPQRAHVR